MSIEIFLWALAALLSLALSLVSAGHALLWKRDPRAALGWIGICLTLPLLGPTLYATFGVNRVRRAALQFLATGRRLVPPPGAPGTFKKVGQRAGGELVEGGPLPVDPVVAETVPAELADLRMLADRVTRRQLVPGNRFEPLENGERAYPPMLAAIEGAKHSVHISTYIFDGDRIGTRFIDALDAAARRGVEVRVIVDALGEKYSWPTARRLLARRNSPVQIGRFLPLRQGAYLNLRTHRKVLIADGTVAFTGGMNIGDRHLVETPSRRGPVRDLHFRVEGPLVHDLQEIFLEDWYFVTGERHEDERCFPPLSEAGEATARAISDGPDEPARKLHWIVIGALAAARRSVRIMTPYFIPDRPLLSAMGAAALRGVEVSLVLPAENNLPFMHWASRSYLWEVIPYGIRVRYQPPPFVHTKLLVVDDVWSLIGSANLDPRSLRLNFELNVEIYDPGTSGRLARRFDETFEKSHPVTLEELDARSLPVRLRDGAAKLFSPYL